MLVFDVTGVLFDFLFSALIGGGVAAFAALAGVGPVNAVGAKLIDATGADVPRLTLPDALDGTFNDFDLKNPNTMSQAEYNAYSGAAIAGTLALFLPGALAIFDISGFIGDFAFSALMGGGAAALLAAQGRHRRHGERHRRQAARRDRQGGVVKRRGVRILLLL